MGARVTVTIVGASGLVGRELLVQLCRDSSISVIHVLGRRAIHLPEDPGNAELVQHQVDFNRLAEFAWPPCDMLFCCLGTTIKAAGSQEAFRTVDYDYVVESARAARRAGATRLLVISAMGANPASGIFYNRVKGEMERAVAGLGYESVLIFRPALLSGSAPGAVRSSMLRKWHSNYSIRFCRASIVRRRRRRWRAPWP